MESCYIAYSFIKKFKTHGLFPIYFGYLGCYNTGKFVTVDQEVEQDPQLVYNKTTAIEELSYMAKICIWLWLMLYGMSY